MHDLVPHVLTERNPFSLNFLLAFFGFSFDTISLPMRFFRRQARLLYSISDPRPRAPPTSFRFCFLSQIVESDSVTFFSVYLAGGFWFSVE